MTQTERQTETEREREREEERRGGWGNERTNTFFINEGKGISMTLFFIQPSGRDREREWKQTRERQTHRESNKRENRHSRKRGRERNGQYEIYLHDKITKDFK